MATFPTTILQLDVSQLDPIPGLQVEIMASGRPNGRNLFDGTTFRGTILCQCTAAEYDTILSFYATNRNLEFTFVWDGDTGLAQEAGTYTAIFIGRPPKREPQPSQFKVSVQIIAWPP